MPRLFYFLLPIAPLRAQVTDLSAPGSGGDLVYALKFGKSFTSAYTSALYKFGSQPASAILAVPRDELAAGICY